MLYDNHNRPINYLRLAVTDRCNLRCQYCMPEEGINYVQREALMSFEEMLRVVSVFSTLGINKVRITGGEPFIRKGIMTFMQELSSIDGMESLHVTTNGTMKTSWIPELKKMGLKSVNLSLDSLDRKRYHEITRRDDYELVIKNFYTFIECEIPVKINMVVLNQNNIDDILTMIELTKDLDISVRFLEEMPFNGTGVHENIATWDHIKILEHIKSSFPSIIKSPPVPNSTSMDYQIPGYLGSFGIIASYTRLFCGSCNRIRLTPTGVLKTCLYDGGVFNVKDLMRSGASNEELCVALTEALSHRAKDGFEAEERSVNHYSESMASIGG